MLNRALKFLAAGAVFTIAAMAQNNGSTSQFTLPVDTDIQACNGEGEFIHLSGEVHAVTHVSTTSNGQVNAFTHSNYRGVTGVGEDTGTIYRAHDSVNMHLVVTPDGQTVQTFEETVSLIATGNNAPSTTSVFVYHMITQPDGTPTLTVDHARSECK